MVIGCCGAGKSTLSKQLHQILGLELIHLDQQYFSPNWVEMEASAWDEKVKELVQKDTWIIDGNYNRTMDIRLEKADTVIFLDQPRWKCFYRVLKRVITNYGQVRPDMAEDCPERFDLEFLIYVARFHKDKRPALLKRIQHLDTNKKLYWLKNDKAVNDFLENVEQEKL